MEAKKYAMLRTVESNEQYETALDLAYKLMQKDLKPDSKESDELEILSVLIKEYENEHYLVLKPNSTEGH